MSEKTKEVLQLNRLQRIMDVIFALVIWRLFMVLPRPDFDNPQWDSVWAMLKAEWPAFVVPTIALLIISVYWMQNNALFGNLKRTDGKHTTISIFQIFFLLFFLYAIGIGLRLGARPDTRAFESVAAILVGLWASFGWRYAVRAGLVDPDASREDIEVVTRQTMAEPVTAALTIPFAFIGPWMWELSWFLYPLIRKILGWRARRRVDVQI
jgi:uncharacterized membrane protein